MPFYQNVFNTEFIGTLLLGDRQYAPQYKCKPNVGREQSFVIAWGNPNFDLSGNDGDGNAKNILTLSFSYDVQDYKYWSDINVELSSDSSVSSEELVTALNEDLNFSDKFVASTFTNSNKVLSVKISQKLDVLRFRFYVKNKGAETVLKFNKLAGVSELPSYFSRHNIENGYKFVDSVGLLTELDVSLVVDQNVINNAVDAKSKSLGYNYNDLKEDWELLAGKSGIFTFQKITSDESDRIIEIIEYPAGAIVGDFARKTLYTYSGDSTNPSTIAEIPYVLTSDDLITPS